MDETAGDVPTNPPPEQHGPSADDTPVEGIPVTRSGLPEPQDSIPIGRLVVPIVEIDDAHAFPAPAAVPTFASTFGSALEPIADPSSSVGERAPVQPVDRGRAAKLGLVVGLVVRRQLRWFLGLAVVAALVFMVGLIVLSNSRSTGDVDESVWAVIGAGWPRWLALAAGIAAVAASLPRLVTNGVTRLATAHAFIGGLVASSALGSLYITAGYVVEHVVYDRNGWVQGLPSGAALETADLPRIAIESVVVLGASYLSGWIVTLGFVRFGTAAGFAIAIPGVLPMVMAELVTSRDFGSVLGTSHADALVGDGTRPELVAAVAAGATVLVAAAVVARAMTRGTVFRAG